MKFEAKNIVFEIVRARKLIEFEELVRLIKLKLMKCIIRKNDIMEMDDIGSYKVKEIELFNLEDFTGTKRLYVEQAVCSPNTRIRIKSYPGISIEKSEA